MPSLMCLNNTKKFAQSASNEACAKPVALPGFTDARE